DFGLDKRLVKAVSKLGFVYPTQVQAQFIPIALQGKDVLVRSQTGSGKTAAFSLPVLQKILLAKAAGAKGASIRAIILAPTKELCRQIEKHATDLMYYCRDSVSVCSLGDDNASAVSYKLQSKPDILVATPAKLVQHLKSSVVDISTVETLVIDEADLILSFGYAEDVQLITSRMPKIFQGLLMSATLSPELDKFKRVVLHNPAVLKISDSKGSGQLLQFYLDSTENDKFLILYVFIKLGLLQGKGLIFVNDVSKCYRLKLFLQQFYIPAAVLNSEVPLNSRLHILEEYNRGVFDYLIATDASIDAGEVDDEEEGEESGAEEEGDENSDSDSEKSDDAMSEEEEEPVKVKSSKSKKLSVDPAAAAASVAASASQSNKGEGYGVSRGIDFQGVNFVINFDLPKTAAAYTHRIGRTARGGASGTALSFVAMAPPTSSASEAEVAARDAEVLHTVRLTQPRLGGGQDGAGSVLAAIGAVPPAPLVFNMKELDSFRYRVEETLRSVTGVAVREFRAAELKQEILNSAKLKSYFAENPDDLKVLRHDTSVAHPIRPKEHLRNVPTYLIPASMRGAATVTNTKKKKRKLGSAQNSQDAKRQKSKSKDPLQSFDVDADSTPADTNAAPAAEPKVFTSGEALGHSISGRQEWKQRHKKGKFNPKNKSK
ncbi:unnamed protein product, partial [Ectocarpus fasciculatus]